MKATNKRSFPLWLKWILCVSPAIFALFFYLFLPFFPEFSEFFFVRILFRSVSIPLSFLISLFPFSVTEMIAILLIPTLVTCLIFFFIHLFRNGNKRKLLEKTTRFLCLLLSLLLFIFMLMHGGNYSRYSVTELMQLNDKMYTAKDLQKVTAYLAKSASNARLSVKEDEKGYMIFSEPLNKTLKNAKIGYSVLQKEYPFLYTPVQQAKPVLLSHYWSYTGITGVYCPWLGEANVNVDVPPSGIPHTAAHELAHTIGFAREDACNFIGFLACIHNENPDYIYSGYLSAYIYCSNALYGYDKTLWKETAALCSDGVNRDLRQRNDYWKNFEGKTMDTADKLNDTFIKVNGVESGVLNYNEAVSLILQYYDTYPIS